MAVLIRRVFGTIELLRVDSDPNGVSAPSGSLAIIAGGTSVYKNVGGTNWLLLSPTTTNVTSIVIEGLDGASAASCIGAGSTFHLYKYEV